ncbi:MAG: DUF3859 domain-containing protein [Xanthobacteraceae bacterium]|nr:DUF3859 domain-containing protein [Xanthobacteraceae bacterium]
MRIGMILWLLILSPCSDVYGSEVSGIRIVEAGIYTARTVKNSDPDSSAPETVDSVRLLESTTVIPASKGIRFGFRYQIVGAARGQQIKLGMVTVFPLPGLRTPTNQTPSLRSATILQRTVGTIAFRGYHFDHDFEILPGLWSFEFWYKGRKLAKQDFCVVRMKPDTQRDRDTSQSCADLLTS